MPTISSVLLSFISHLNSITAHPPGTSYKYCFFSKDAYKNLNKVSAIGLCRDVKPNECRSCLKNASSLVPAIGGYGECFLRYSNRSILGIMQADVSYYLRNTFNITDQDKYNQVVSELLQALRQSCEWIFTSNPTLLFIIKPSCNIRFENYRFYYDDELAAEDSPSQASPPTGVADSPKASSSFEANSNRTSRNVLVTAFLTGAFITL